MNQELANKLRKERKEMLQQTFRLKKTNEKGEKVTLPPQYKNEKIWMEVTDVEMFLKLFPPYLHHITNELEDWYIFVKKSNPALANIAELKAKADKIIKQYEVELSVYEAKYNRDIKLINQKLDITKVSYYTLLDICNKLKLKVDKE